MADPLVGRKLGDFQIEELLGRGKMTAVYRATQVSLQRPVALKILPVGGLTPEKVQQDFLREAEAAARLLHHAIVPVYTAGQEGIYLYMAMRHVTGGTLAQAMAAGITRARSVRFAVDIADALAYAHQQGLAHGEVTPRNILLDGDHALLGDFGVAKIKETTSLSTSGERLMASWYMAPETTGSTPPAPGASTRADLFSLGVVLFEATLGIHPFRPPRGHDKSITALIAVSQALSRHDWKQPEDIDPHCPAPLCAVLKKAVQPLPENRFASATVFRDALTELVELPAIQADTRAVAAPDVLPPASSARVSASAPCRDPVMRRPGPVSPGVAVPEPEPPPPAPAGRPFGRYILQDEIGHGGVGAIYRAFQTDTGRTVALKVLISGPGSDDTMIRRFKREATAAARLRHPGIVPIHEVGVEDGEHFFTMDLIEGDSLEAALKAKSVDFRRGAEIVKAVADAVHHAHTQGIIHRDLKPANILLGRDGVVRVTDFGLARELASGEPRLTMKGQMLGTPDYMSPEQARAEADRIGPPSDVFSLGIVLYEILAGHRPFKGETTMLLLGQTLKVTPPRPSEQNPQVPQDLENICFKALEKDPALRYPSAAALAEDLGRWLTGRPVEARALTRWQRFLTRFRKKPAQ